MKIIQNTYTLYHFLRVLINPDKNIVSLIKVGDAVVQSQANKIVIDKLFEAENLENNYKTRKGLESWKLEELKAHPEGSLGKTFFHFLTENKLDIFPIDPDQKLTRPIYVSQRIRKVHDLLHVLLGYGIDLIGEAKVNAFVVAQTKATVSTLVLCVLVIRFFFKNPADFVEILNGIQEGYSEGKKYKNFLAMDWEGMMDEPLYKVKEEFRKDQDAGTIIQECKGSKAPACMSGMAQGYTGVRA